MIDTFFSLILADAPLAEGFMLRDGQVEITVPDFPPRDNYIVVLMGDSGNSSPEFRIEGGTPEGPISSPDPAPSPAPTSSPASSSPTLITDPIPITGTTITGTLSESPEGVFTSSTADSEISTPPVESTSISVNITPSESESAAPTPDSSESTESSSSSSTSSSTGTAEAANSEETPSSAAWSGHHISAKTIILGMATFSLALVL
ncbi:hypothetical protein AX16_002913 [Volvariella volvacea WC 439]|nr:hypothetical protein AX16_002913 [Volvariella volvacea WC 439]